MRYHARMASSSGRRHPGVPARSQGDTARGERGQPVGNRAMGRLLGGGDGLPPRLQAGLEQMSGFDLSGVRVRRGSAEPARHGALAHARGMEIHVRSGHDDKLGEEAWHVVQQLQGRVRPTGVTGGRPTNADPGLEREAVARGAEAWSRGRTAPTGGRLRAASVPSPVVQRAVDVSSFKASKNGRYMVDPYFRMYLYAKHGSTAPEPTGLFVRTADVTTDGQKLDVYRPNVKLTTIGEGSRKFVESAREVLGTKRGLAKVTMGVLGGNDCLAFANTLQTLIAFERLRKSDWNEDSLGDGTEGVGTLMKHTFDHTGAVFHGATAIAKDDSTLVTLEAHASKKLGAPEFHLREGSDGFVRSNQKSYKSETGIDALDTKTVRHLSSRTVDDVIATMTRMKAQYAAMPGDPSRSGSNQLGLWLDRLSDRAYVDKKLDLEESQSDTSDDDYEMESRSEDGDGEVRLVDYVPPEDNWDDW